MLDVETFNELFSTQQNWLNLKLNLVGRFLLTTVSKEITKDIVTQDNSDFIVWAPTFGLSYMYGPDGNIMLIGTVVNRAKL